MVKYASSFVRGSNISVRKNYWFIYDYKCTIYF